MSMPLTTSAVTILEKRYLQKDEEGNVVETPNQMFQRVANAVGETEEQRQDFYNALSNLDFLCNSPCLMNAGTPLNQLSACFVLPIHDSMESIYKTLGDTAMVQRTGGGTGFSFSHLRPRGDLVSGTQGTASGPVSFLKVFDASTGEIKQGGKRRGANMAVLNAHHPDIFEFIGCKDSENKQITNFNISVWAYDNFFKALKDAGDTWPLINPRTGGVVNHISAAAIFEHIINRAWETGDPGIIFATAMEAGNPTPWIGKYESTNPCAEQPLLPYEACVLGSINLTHCLTNWAVVGRPTSFDFERLRVLTRLGVWFLNRCIDIQAYTLPEIEAMHKNGNRKIGLGVMGYADVLSQMGIPYGSPKALDLALQIMSTIQETGHDESQELGHKNGVFPNFEAEGGGRNARKESFEFPRDHVYNQQRRNATVTTIAPTGTISIIAECSYGIEPHFALATKRMNVLDGEDLYDFNPILKEVLSTYLAPEGNMWGQPDLTHFVEDNGFLPANAPVELLARFPTVVGNDITVEDHLRTQAAFQKYTDNGVSKTVNLPKECSEQDIAKTYLRAHELGIKAVAIYRDQSKSTQVLNAGKDPQAAELAGIILQESRLAREGSTVLILDSKKEAVAIRPVSLAGHTERVETGIGALYITVNERDGLPFEVFAQVGRAGSEVSAFTEGLARLTSLALRSGVPANEVATQLIGIGGSHTNGFGNNKVLSIPDALGKVLAHVLHNEPQGDSAIAADICPSCHQATLIHEEGCEHCACGYSDC